jgi:hypothetical protein
MNRTPTLTETFQPAPAAAIIKLVRKGANIPISRAAELGGISEVRWMQIEKGEETRGGVARQANPKPETIAYMALGVNRAAGTTLITPERIEDEGRNPEAARYLREAMRQDAARPQPAPPPAEPGDEPMPPVLARLGPVPDQYYASVDEDPAPRDDFERVIWEDSSPVPLGQRRALVAWHRMVAEGASRQRGASG